MMKRCARGRAHRKAGAKGMSMEMVPYSFEGTVQLPPGSAIAAPGVVNGVDIVVESYEVRDWLAQKLSRWFAEREEVAVVDVGFSDKQGTGYLIVEWDESEIDPLFL